ncbi:MAG: energy transducer TonB [Deltaproteobacteria bacterium]|nr:energy transducer TonB [Deltaproteobacteria bacterium]
MNETVHLPPLPDFDDPWRRLPWVTPIAVTVWIALLAAFAFMLQRTGPQPSELKPLEARIIELPPEVGGLAGGGGGVPAPHPAAATPSKPKVAPPVPPVVHRKKLVPPPLPVSPNGTATTSAAPAPAPGGAASGTGLESSSGAGGTGGGGGSGSGSGSGGIGNDNLGAHAIYAPVPEIPDDLRENAIQTVAVAHFKVTYDGEVTVSLATRTENPRLNEILLHTLKEWRFFPAMKNGVAIDSEFDLKIPITVQ